MLALAGSSTGCFSSSTLFSVKVNDIWGLGGFCAESAKQLWLERCSKCPESAAGSGITFPSLADSDALAGGLSW